VRGRARLGIRARPHLRRDVAAISAVPPPRPCRRGINKSTDYKSQSSSASHDGAHDAATDSAAQVGRRIKLARSERGFTQDELAALASFSKRSLQDYERGVTIPYRHLRELGELLGRPVSWFLYGNRSGLEGDDRLARMEARMDEGLAAVLSAVRELHQTLQR
jgi:transcriptional regulator with XRE-family HTH domain